MRCLLWNSFFNKNPSGKLTTIKGFSRFVETNEIALKSGRQEYGRRHMTNANAFGRWAGRLQFQSYENYRREEFFKTKGGRHCTEWGFLRSNVYRWNTRDFATATHGPCMKWGRRELKAYSESFHGCIDPHFSGLYLWKFLGQRQCNGLTNALEVRPPSSCWNLLYLFYRMLSSIPKRGWRVLKVIRYAAPSTSPSAWGLSTHIRKSLNVHDKKSGYSNYVEITWKFLSSH